MKIILSILIFISCINAQDLPWDKSLIRGELNNGFKYTIRKNSKPAGKAEIRLVIKAGSLEEDDDQKGVAHLVEHMAFNGTKHFKKNSLISYLESIGVSFGSHLNAMTSMNQTQYQLSIPLTKDNLEKSFLIFRDWAGDITFDPIELEKERGVVLEEARSRDTASSRIYEQAKNTLYEGSKYKDRTPIGDLDIIKNIKISRIKDFYNDWYRPELMHFVIVGDFDVKIVETLIKTTFSDLKNTNHREKAIRTIPKINKKRVLFTSDSELTGSSLSYYIFHDYKKAITENDFKKDLIKNMALRLFNQTFSSQITKENPISQSLGAGSNIMGTNLQPIIFSANYQGMKEKEALNELSESIYTIDKFGFDKFEFDALLKDKIANNEDSYKVINDTNSNFYASRLAIYSLDDDVFIDQDFQYKFLKEFYSEVTIEDLNKAFSGFLKSDSFLVNYSLSTQNKISKRSIFKTIKDAKKNVKRPYVDPNLPKKILTKNLLEKKIKKEKYNKKFDFWEFTLANDIKVIFKKNTYNKKKVRLYSFSDGGHSLIKQEDILTAKYSPNIIANSGLSKYSLKEISRIYAGKRANVRPYISRYSEGFSGTSLSKDFETLLEMLYLYHTEYKVNENILRNTKSISAYRAKVLHRDPRSRFSKDYQSFVYNNDKRHTKETAKEIYAVNKDKILEIYKDRFLDSNNFTYIIVGDIEYKEVKKLMSKYVANLPTNPRKETYKDRKIKPINGEHKLLKYYANKNISRVSFFLNLLKWSYKKNIV